MARDYLVFVTEEIIHSNLSKILWLDFICSPCEKLVKLKVAVFTIITELTI